MTLKYFEGFHVELLNVLLPLLRILTSLSKRDLSMRSLIEYRVYI